MGFHVSLGECSTRRTTDVSKVVVTPARNLNPPCTYIAARSQKSPAHSSSGNSGEKGGVKLRSTASVPGIKVEGSRLWDLVVSLNRGTPNIDPKILGNPQKGAANFGKSPFRV